MSNFYYRKNNETLSHVLSSSGNFWVCSPSKLALIEQSAGGGIVTTNKGSTKYYSHDSSAGVTDLCGHTITTTESPYITTDNSHWGGSLSTGYYDIVSINDVTIGGSDLTVDFWINILGDPGCYKDFMKIKDNNSDKDWNWTRHDNYNTTYYYVFGDSFGGSRGSTWGVNGNYSGSEPSYVYNTWVHVAWVYNYSDDTLKMYVNGTVKGSHTGATTLRPVRNCTVRLGGWSDMYDYRSRTRNNRQLYDEFRMSNCQRWTSTFTPQTGPYTKDNNTIVLCHFN